MGIELGSLGHALGKDGILDVTGTFLSTINNFVKAAGYFTGEGFQDALANGFMA